MYKYATYAFASGARATSTRAHHDCAQLRSLYSTAPGYNAISSFVTTHGWPTEDLMQREKMTAVDGTLDGNTLINGSARCRQHVWTDESRKNNSYRAMLCALMNSDL